MTLQFIAVTVVHFRLTPTLNQANSSATQLAFAASMHFSCCSVHIFSDQRTWKPALKKNKTTKTRISCVQTWIDGAAHDGVSQFTPTHMFGNSRLKVTFTGASLCPQTRKEGLGHTPSFALWGPCVGQFNWHAWSIVITLFKVGFSAVTPVSHSAVSGNALTGVVSQKSAVAVKRLSSQEAHLKAFL